MQWKKNPQHFCKIIGRIRLVEELIYFTALTDVEGIKPLSFNNANSSSVLKQMCQSSSVDLNNYDTTTITGIWCNYHVLINFCLTGHK